MKVLKLATALLFLAGFASGAPCTLGVTIQPAAPVAGQTISIYYSAPYLGFIQTPSVSIDASQISIDQPNVHADPAYPGHIPCGERTIEVGSLPAGYYDVNIHLSSAPSMSASFIVGPAPVRACGSTPASFVRASGPASGILGISVTANGRSVLLHFENQNFAEFVDGGSYAAPVLGTPTVSVDGYRIQVTQAYAPLPSGPVGDAGPGIYAFFCQSQDIDLGALAAGKYTLTWTYITDNGPVSVTSTFTNGLNPRGRAIRGH
jgi:hypothetical protein